MYVKFMHPVLFTYICRIIKKLEQYSVLYILGYKYDRLHAHTIPRKTTSCARAAKGSCPCDDGVPGFD